jgi:hypothetical protein
VHPPARRSYPGRRRWLGYQGGLVVAAATEESPSAAVGCIRWNNRFPRSIVFPSWLISWENRNGKSERVFSSWTDLFCCISHRISSDRLYMEAGDWRLRVVNSWSTWTCFHRTMEKRSNGQPQTYDRSHIENPRRTTETIRTEPRKRFFLDLVTQNSKFTKPLFNFFRQMGVLSRQGPLALEPIQCVPR